MTASSLSDLYSREETERMGDAFDMAWRCIEETHSSLAHPDRQIETRERLAAAVIRCLREVEPRTEELRNAALLELGFVAVEVSFGSERALN